MVKDVWWDNVIFREFAAHFISMSDEQVVRDIRESVVKVINLDESGDSFGANMVRRAKERLCGRHNIAVQNGQKGGRPKKSNGDADTREGSEATTTVSTNIGDAIGGLAAELCAGANDSSRVESAQAGSHNTGKAPARIPAPRDRQEVFDFAASHGLDYDDTRLWWERNFVERDGTDKEGKPFANWKGALVNACMAEAMKRRTA